MHSNLAGHMANGLVGWLLLVCACSLYAEETGKTPPGPGVPAAPGLRGAASSPAGMSERELYLLNEIQLLKQRLSELEARLAGGLSGNFHATPAAHGHESEAAITSVTVPGGITSGITAGIPAKPPLPGRETKAEAKKAEPFAFADFTWLNGNSRTKDSPLDSKVLTGEFRADTSYIYDFAHPRDHTLGGTTESGRTGEVQLQQLGIGGDFHWENVRGRLMTQFGMYSTMTPRNDASSALGQWNLSDAYRYISEAYGGYHFDKLHGINVDAGIFMSYVGLFSYYNFDNWAYQPSYVSSNTPWFYNGVRVQVFPTEKLKIEPWFINGWQSYGKFNSRPGLGAQFLYRPNGSIAIISNNYGVGADTPGVPGRARYHSDNSI
jgi:hypothetical protein